MQKDWRLVLFTTCGLIFSWLSSPSFGGEVLQQSKTGQDFDFAGFDAVFLAVTLPEDDLFLTTFKRELGSRGAVKV